MSISASRKSFLSKLALCAVALGAMPGLLVRRFAGGASPTTPETGGAGAETVGSVIALKADTRAIERDPSAS